MWWHFIKAIKNRRLLFGKTLCPRCREREVDRMFLGRDGEGNICAECWKGDRAEGWSNGN